MDKGFISVIKVKYNFKEGNTMQGLELNLAPKVKKFIHLTKDNCDLLKMFGNGLLDWYNRAEFGDDIVLTAYTGKDKIVNNFDSDSVAVNFK